METGTVTDPFAAPAVIPSSYPTIASLRGRLVLITPLKQQTVPNRMNPGTTQEQITANVAVVDGGGPVPQMAGNPAQPTGLMIDGPQWNGMWINSEVIVKQLAEALASRGMVLGRVETPNPNAPAGKGNAYGLVHPTEDDKNVARAFLANRTVGAAMPPAAAPQYPQAAAAPVSPAAQPAPAQAVPVAPPAVPVPGSAPVGVNPFAR